MTTELILKPKQLRLEDLPFLHALGHVDGDNFVLDHSPKGYKLKTPVKVPINRILKIHEWDLVEYIVNSLIRERPRLIPLVLENQSLINLADYFLTYRSGSLQSLYAYVDTINRYASLLRRSPDRIIADVKSKKGCVKPARVQKHSEILEKYVRLLQGRKLTPGRVHLCAKYIKSFYKVNGIEVKLAHTLPRRVVCKDRAPKPEELQRLLDVADLRGRVIVTIMALGGFREETLTRLRYRHVRQDLEGGRVPLHIHVESNITKGKYDDYDAFLGGEAVEYLRLYLDARRQGSPDGKMPRENIQDDSPLIKDSKSRIPKPIGPKQIRKLVHHLYSRAGLVNDKTGRMYNLRVHSIRKFFKTEMEGARVNSDYVEYMMGHKVSTYHDVQGLGVEKLRNAYASAGLSIRPRTGINKVDMVKEFAKGLGLNPEEILVKNAFSEPETKYVDPEERELSDIRALMQAIKANLLKAQVTA